MKSKLLIVLILILTFTSFTLAAPGCCINPETFPCGDVAEMIDCCPDDSVTAAYVQEGDIGPYSQGACEGAWYSNDNLETIGINACGEMDEAYVHNARFCNDGCCCVKEVIDVEGESTVTINSGQAKELVCAGETKYFIPFSVLEAEEKACNVEACTDAMFAIKDHGDLCMPFSGQNSCDPQYVSDPSVYCKRNAVVDNIDDPYLSYSGDGTCCYGSECIAEYEGVIQCVPSSTSPFPAEWGFLCELGYWISASQVLEHEDLCAETAGFYPNGYPLLNVHGHCGPEMDCSPALLDDSHYLCCEADECGYWNDTYGRCFSDGGGFQLEYSGEIFNHSCRNGDWVIYLGDTPIVPDVAVPHDGECNVSIDCVEGLTCVSYNLPEGTPNAGIKRCCADTECSGENACVAQNTQVVLSAEHTWACVSPLWSELAFTPQPNDPNNGGEGGCGPEAPGGAPAGDVAPASEDPATTEEVIDEDEDGSSPPEDCVDTDAAINPSATEVCDGIDNNCNNETDEGFPDTDSDGTPDCLDEDDDDDRVLDKVDNCPLVANPDQKDKDDDSIGDECDSSDDRNWFVKNTWAVVSSAIAVGAIIGFFVGGLWPGAAIGAAIGAFVGWVITWFF